MRTLILVLMVGAVSGTAYAQGARAGSSGFVLGGIAVDGDQNTYNDETVDSRPAVYGGIGVGLPRRWNVRFEATEPMWHDQDYSFAYGSSQVTSVSGINRHRISTYTGLLGRDFGTGRVVFTVLGGGGVALHADREREVRTVTTAGRTADAERFDRNASEALGVVAFGVDVAVALTDTVALVPSFRTYAFPQYEQRFSMWRPGVAVRWRF
jgi:hypothetical protein